MAAAAPRVRAAGVMNNLTLQNYLEDPTDVERDLAAALAGQWPREQPGNAVAPVPRNLPTPRGGLGDHPVDVNAVAVVNRAVTQPIPVTPDWHDVRNLPGYQQGGALRRIIRKTFEQVSEAQLEEMRMICDLLNPPAHVQAVARWVAKNATPVDAADFDYSRTVPGFAAQFRVFQDEKSTFIITQDVGGHYVYICPGGLRQRTPQVARQAEAITAAAPQRRVSFDGPGAA